MRFYLVCLCSFFLTLHHTFALSSLRKESEDYTFYEHRYLKDFALDKSRPSPISVAKYYSESDQVHAVGWSSLQVMQERFEKIRDERFLIWKKRPNSLRRIPWLYPTDGCWVRAVLFNRNAYRLYIPLPNTIYAFGNLSIQTPNHRWGKVGWWFHVASVVEVQAQKYVMDPALEPQRPLLLREWLERMGQPEKIKIAICSSGTFSPGDDCSKETNGMEISAVSASQFYLGSEWENLKTLGRNPELELGDRPPW